MIARVYDNLFSPRYMGEIEEIVENLPVTAINCANGQDYPMGSHGTHRLFGENIFERVGLNRVMNLSPKADKFFTMFEHIQSVVDEDYLLTRIDFNLQHSFCDGSYHIDGGEEDEFTIMYMVNTKWDSDEWGGQFQICDDNYNIIEEHEFIPGRVLIFPGYYKHRGLGPRHPYVYRYTVVWRVETLLYSLNN